MNRKPASDLVYRDLEGKAFTFYPSDAEQLPDGSLKFTQHLRFGDVEARWNIDSVSCSDIKVDMTVRLSDAGFVSIASPTLAVFEDEEIAWGMIPGNWYGTEISSDLALVKEYSMGIPNVPMLATERNTMTLSPLYMNRDGLTLAVIPDPGTENNPYPATGIDRSKNRVAFSLMNRHSEFTPVVYHPVLGQEGSKNEAGAEVRFGFRYSLMAADWFDVFSHAVNEIFCLPSLLDLQTNGVSLSERLSRLQKFLRKEKESGWNVWESRGTRIGANGSKIADAGTMYMIARNGDDSVMRQRLPYVRNYKLIQQQTDPGFFKGAALGEYADEDGVASERGNWIEPLHTTYYTMVDLGNMLLFDPEDEELRARLRLAADKLLDWQNPDGSFDVGYDSFTQRLTFPDLKDYRPTWYGLLIAYNQLGERKYLDAACRGADWQKSHGVDKGYFLGVCGDARNIWDFCTAQTAQAYLDLYEVTGREAYKDAAITSARIYATSIFTYPVATDEVKYVGGVPRKDWEINQTGLGVEHIRGTAVNGPILITSYAGLFVRIYEWTKEPLFLTMARAAARGRNAFVDQESGCALYYWHSLENVKAGATMFPWHAYWQMGWILDYLFSEAHLRSGGEVKFPYGYMTPKVGPHVTYGFAAGKIYGRDAELILRPDLVKCDNADVEYVVARSLDGRKLYLVVLSQSPRMQSCTLTVDTRSLSGAESGIRKVSCLRGAVQSSHSRTGEVRMDLAPWDLQVVELTLR
ncbi:MAG TPA: glycerophosphoryl diester phosphodiesterase [Candidatus Alistipes intestinipullorum]|nr:glycerophosphoryl diester phosphodiesterase [Candidatus Alistipes intestinipullorum]